VNVLVVLFLGRCENVGRRAHLDSQCQLGVDAVSGLCALLRCHFIGIWRGSWAVVEVVVGRLAAEVGVSSQEFDLCVSAKVRDTVQVREGPRAERCAGHAVLLHQHQCPTGVRSTDQATND
jgi:Na+-translocating ferredoxin:NAD+ oxidoreductase RnfA subunit